MKTRIRITVPKDASADWWKILVTEHLRYSGVIDTDPSRTYIEFQTISPSDDANRLRSFMEDFILLR